MLNKRPYLIYYLLPLAIGGSFLLLYHLSPIIHFELGVLLLCTFGIWFSLAIIKTIKLVSPGKINFNQTAFVALGFFAFFISFIYLSKAYDYFLSFRRLTYLSLDGLFYLLLLCHALKIKVRYYDYLLLFTYSTIIQLYFTEPGSFLWDYLEYKLAIWMTLFLIHIIWIVQKDNHKQHNRSN
jgi:hypothetical protein